MSNDTTGATRSRVDEALRAGKPADAAAYLAELVAVSPDDRNTRLALAIALGDAGQTASALKIMRALADRLAHDGYLLPAMVVIRQGIERAPSDSSLLGTLGRIHVRGVRAKAGNLATPPALKSKGRDADTVRADDLLKLEPQARFEKITQIGTTFSPAGEAAIPLPMPLFSELDEEAFVETVKRLHYRRVPKETKLLVEGEKGDTLLVVASGHVRVEKAGQKLAKLGPGMVLGEMALLTGAPRSATVIADEEVEVFELARADVEQLAKAKPRVAEELVEYCRKRIIGNLLRTSPLFAKFDDEARYGLIDRFKRVGFQPGKALITQGQEGQGLFVIATGDVQVNVQKDGGESVTVANLGPGQVVGEISLLHSQPANATVLAHSLVGALFLPRNEFQDVLKKHPDVHAYLQGLSADRLKATQAAHDDHEVLDADDLIVL